MGRLSGEPLLRRLSLDTVGDLWTNSSFLELGGEADPGRYTVCFLHSHYAVAQHNQAIYRFGDILI